jgi:hypothetical protein
MPQFDIYSFFFQSFLILTFFFSFYFIFLKFFLVTFSKLLKFRLKLKNIILNTSSYFENKFNLLKKNFYNFYNFSNFNFTFIKNRICLNTLWGVILHLFTAVRFYLHDIIKNDKDIAINEMIANMEKNGRLYKTRFHHYI